MLRVTRRRSQGRSFQFSAPSLTIWPAMVQTTAADTPESNKAGAKTVPAAVTEDLFSVISRYFGICRRPTSLFTPDDRRDRLYASFLYHSVSDSSDA